MHGFEDPEVLKECRKLETVVSELVNSFPPEEKCRLVDQVIGSCCSVKANIAERIYFISEKERNRNRMIDA